MEAILTLVFNESGLSMCTPIYRNYLHLVNPKITIINSLRVLFLESNPFRNRSAGVSEYYAFLGVMLTPHNTSQLTPKYGPKSINVSEKKWQDYPAIISSEHVTSFVSLARVSKRDSCGEGEINENIC